MHDPLLGAEPPQLRVVHELAPHAAHVREKILDVTPHEVFGKRLDGGDCHVVAPSDGEDETVTFLAIIRIRTHTQVRRGVVRVGIHRIRTVERQRGREPDVCSL